MPQWYGGSALNPDDVPKDQQWLNQLYRLNRWYIRVEKICSKSISEDLSDDDIDTIIAYFQNCYHLKDWLLESLPTLKSKLNDDISKSFEMGACRDICNGYKHKFLTNPTHDAFFNFYREYDYDASPGDNPTKYRFAFADGNTIKKYDAFELAKHCQVFWLTFIKANFQLS